MACRSFLRCMQQGLMSRHVVPAASTAVSSNNGGKRCITVNKPPITSKFEWYRMATYCLKYFVALTKDCGDPEIEMNQTPEQLELEHKQMNALKVRVNDAELLKAKPIPEHEMVLEAMRIYMESGNWKYVNEIYLGSLIEEQMYDYIDPEFLKEVEDWLHATHPRWILYDSIKY